MKTAVLIAISLTSHLLGSARQAVLVAALAATATLPAWAGTCNTLPVAVGDDYDAFGIAFVADVLSNDRDDDGEALKLTLLSNNCTPNNTISVANGLLHVGAIQASCSISYRITDERGETSTATATLTLHGALFSDGFETGNTSPWDTATAVVEDP
jgi:hypothetical protein